MSPQKKRGTPSPQEKLDDSREPHHSAADSPEHVARPIHRDAAVLALRYGPRGALAIASIAVGLLFLGWLAFYFLLFLPRGPVG
jgi:hypothetical protein